MASPIIRNGLTSPARTMMRPILKRPTPLPLSPATQTSNFSSLVSPSSQMAIKSTRVHFPSSPSKLVATIGTYSSNAYNRAPISVSPNPVTLPGRGERVYSPTLEGFRLAAAPKMFRSFSMAYQPSPVISDFEDPRSPKLQPAADVTGAKAANAVRFARTATKQVPKALDEAITSYPRSPYPTATFNQGVDAEMESRGRQLPRSANEISGSARARARAQSIGARQFVRNKKGLTLGGRATPADFTPIPSPLGQSFVPTSSVQSTSLNRPNKPAPLALEVDSAGSDQLSNAFWDSVAIDVPSADEPMVTALEYPESAVEFEEKADMQIRSAVQPSLMFAGADGVLFSPGLPKPHSHRVGALRGALEQAMMSPSVKRTSFQPIARKEITAPSPNDPFAAFPSFGAALEMTGLQYPPAVVQIV